MASNIYKQFVIYKTSSNKAKRQQIRHHILRLANHYSDDYDDYPAESVDAKDAKKLLDKPIEDIESLSKNKIPTPSVPSRLKGLVDMYEDGLVENTLPEEMFYMAPDSDKKSKEVERQEQSEEETVRPPKLNRNASVSYAAIVTRENNQYLARFPHAPGCQTFASSIGQLKKNASEALHGWLLTSLQYNDSIAQPKPISAKNAMSVAVSPKIAIALKRHWNKS